MPLRWNIGRRERLVMIKIIIDILHPAQVHFFRNFIREMERKNNEVIITARKKEMTLDLLDEYGFDYTAISEIQKSKRQLLYEFIRRSIKFNKIVKATKPDLLMGVMGPTISVIGKLNKIPSIVFYDTEVARITNSFSYPLASAVCTPSCYEGKVRGNHITYEGYHELAYLHPKRFKPRRNVLKEYGLKKNKFFIIRFVSWKSSHDIGGYGLKNKYALVKKLKEYGEVFITSEQKLPKTLKKYELNISYKQIHSFLYYAKMLIGESATMATESAILGTPALYVSSSKRGYINELESKYGLVYNFSDQKPALSKVNELLHMKDLNKRWEEKRRKMLKDKIDVTKWMVDFVEKKKWKKFG